MKIQDARKLSVEAQEALRYRVVNAVNNGMGKTQAAEVFAVSRTSIHKWTKAVNEGGSRALKAKAQGRPKETRLAPHQAATTVRLILQRSPEQLGLPFVLWTREAVGQLLEERYGLSLSVWTVGRYLKRWGLTPQKPLRRAYQQDPKAVEHWLSVEYPAIVKRAKESGAEIHWGDEMGVRSDYQAGCSYGRCGQTPVVEGTGKRFSFNLIATLTNRGKLAFMLFSARFEAKVMIEFLRRLIRHSERKVFLIVDGHPVHRSKAVRDWLERHAEEIELFFIPGYSPQLNPAELLNNDVKANAAGRQRPKTKAEMRSNLRSYLYSTQRQPEVVKRYFHEQHVAYAAS